MERLVELLQASVIVIGLLLAGSAPLLTLCGILVATLLGGFTNNKQ